MATTEGTMTTDAAAMREPTAYNDRLTITDAADDLAASQAATSRVPSARRADARS